MTAAPLTESVEPVEALQEPPPPLRAGCSAEVVGRLCRVAARLGHEPEQLTLPWTVAAVSHRGFVRQDNQDAALAMQLGELQVLAIADGVGGLPHGARAAREAVFGAGCHLAAACAAGTNPTIMLVQGAFMSAANRLHTVGRRIGVRRLQDGLRTTLMIILGTSDRYFVGHAGDGAAIVLRADDSHRALFRPHKAPGHASAITVSMGPTVIGRPAFLEHRRWPGDLLLAGTDGVFDRLTDHARFAHDVRRAAIQKQGDLGATARAVVDELAAAQDVGGYICDDNLTLALMGSESVPRLEDEIICADDELSPSAPWGLA